MIVTLDFTFFTCSGSAIDSYAAAAQLRKAAAERKTAAHHNCVYSASVKPLVVWWHRLERHCFFQIQICCAHPHAIPAVSQLGRYGPAAAPRLLVLQLAHHGAFDMKLHPVTAVPGPKISRFKRQCCTVSAAFGASSLIVHCPKSDDRKKHVYCHDCQEGGRST